MWRGRNTDARAGPSVGRVPRRRTCSSPVCPRHRRARDEAKRTAVVLSPAIGKWLRGCGAADAAVGGITWRKVQQPNKKVGGHGPGASGWLWGSSASGCGAPLPLAVGLLCLWLLRLQLWLLPRLQPHHMHVLSRRAVQGIWWVPEATDAMQPAQLGTAAALRAVAAAAGSGEGGLSGPQLLQLAAALRMTTGTGPVAGGCAAVGLPPCVVYACAAPAEQRRALTRGRAPPPRRRAARRVLRGDGQRGLRGCCGEAAAPGAQGRAGARGGARYRRVLPAGTPGWGRSGAYGGTRLGRAGGRAWKRQEAGAGATGAAAGTMRLAAASPSPPPHCIPSPPQEKSWNAYYAHLLLRLCGVGKSHKMTLQVPAAGAGCGTEPGPCAPCRRARPGHLSIPPACCFPCAPTALPREQPRLPSRPVPLPHSFASGTSSRSWAAWRCGG